MSGPAFYAHWSREDSAWVGKCPQYPHLWFLSEWPSAALEGIKARWALEDLRRYEDELDPPMWFNYEVTAPGTFRLDGGSHV